MYECYGFGAAKNLHLMVQLLLLGRTANLWKLKDYVGMVLGNEHVQPDSHYRGLIRFFNDRSVQEGFVLGIQCLVLLYTSPKLQPR